MGDETKTKPELIRELEELRNLCAELQASEHVVSHSELIEANLQLQLEIEKHKRTEQKLRLSAQRYRAFFQSSRDGYAIVNNRDLIVESNAAFKNMLGYTKQELRQKTMTDITPAKWHSFEQKIIRKQLQKYDYSDVYHKEYRRKDGTTFPVEVRSYLLRNARGAHKGMWIFARDISHWKMTEDALRTSKQRYRAVTEDMPAMVCRFLADGTLSFVNKAYREYFKRSNEELVGQNFFQFIPEEHRVEVRRNFTALKRKNPMITYEQEVFTPDAGIHWQQWTVRALFNKVGEVVEYQSIGMDITESKRAQEQRNHFLKQLQHAQKMEAIGTLASGIAHDFNNLLQSIIGYTDLLLLCSEERDTAQRAIEQIIRAAERGADLTRQLLTFSRKVESKLRPINLNGEVEKTKKLLERTLPKMIAIELDLVPELKTVNADPAQIGQVLMNLALNAKDAMPDGGRLTVKTANIAARTLPDTTQGRTLAGDHVLLSVGDTGYGIARETVEHIFDPFFTTKGLASGTGLGLAMVYGIVQSHGGHIECHSKVGSGTTFNIYLPAIERQAEPEHALLIDFPGGGKETILLVDDEQPIRELIHKSLNQLGYRVKTAPDGQRALEIYRYEQDHIDLIILDLLMPGLSGKQCLEELLKLNPQAKVLVSSGYCDVPHIKEMLARGAKKFLSKPYQLQEMCRTIREVIENQ